jgi:hypothetical protein
MDGLLYKRPRHTRHEIRRGIRRFRPFLNAISDRSRLGMPMRAKRTPEAAQKSCRFQPCNECANFSGQFPSLRLVMLRLGLGKEPFGSPQKPVSMDARRRIMMTSQRGVRSSLNKGIPRRSGAASECNVADRSRFGMRRSRGGPISRRRGHSAGGGHGAGTGERGASGRGSRLQPCIL